MTIALLCGIVVGVWPAWRVSRLASLSGVLHEAGTRTGSDSTSRQRARGALVVTQVALALVLLAGAGLTLKSFWNSQNAALGFDPEDILTMTLSLPKARYDSDEKVANFNRQLIERIEALPGVAAAAIGENIPFDGTEWDSSFHITGTPPAQPGKEPSAEVNVISPDYFKVMKMPILRGRTFGPEERPKQPHSVIIDDSFAVRYFPNQNPIGQHIDDNQTNDPNPPPLTIVGVVPRVRSDVPGEEFDRQHLPQMYFCAAQMATYENNLLVRVKSGDPSLLANAVVREVQSIDPDQPVADISTMKTEHFRKPGDPTPNDDAARFLRRPRARPGERRTLRGDGLECDAANTRIWNSPRPRRAARRMFSGSPSDAGCYSLELDLRLVC